MYTVVMPKLGDTMEEGKILNWLKQEGDSVAKGDALAEIETEKVNIEVEAFKPGVLRRILVPSGATVPVGAPIALTGAPDEPLPSDVEGPTTAAATATGSASVSSPSSTDSALTPPHALSQASVKPESIAPSVAPSATAGVPGANGYVAPATIQNVPSAASDRIFISPIARRLAAENSLDIAQ